MVLHLAIKELRRRCVSFDLARQMLKKKRTEWIVAAFRDTDRALVTIIANQIAI